MRQETPEPWASAMVAAGLDDRGRPSIRALARKAQEATGTVRPSVETVRRLVHGMGVAEPETVNAVAKALRVDVRHVTGWAGGVRTVAKPYQPPAEADLLTARQRKAVDEIIRAMADREGQADGTPMTADHLGDPGDPGNLAVIDAETNRRAGRRSKPQPPTLEDIHEGRAAAHKTRGKKDRQS